VGIEGIENDQDVDVAVAVVITTGDGPVEPDGDRIELGAEIGGQHSSDEADGTMSRALGRGTAVARQGEAGCGVGLSGVASAKCALARMGRRDTCRVRDLVEGAIVTSDLLS
jgi:hypothetical protein